MNDFINSPQPTCGTSGLGLFFAMVRLDVHPVSVRQPHPGVDWCCIVLAYLLLGSQLKKACLSPVIHAGKANSCDIHPNTLTDHLQKHVLLARHH